MKKYLSILGTIVAMGAHLSVYARTDTITMRNDTKETRSVKFTLSGHPKKGEKIENLSPNEERTFSSEVKDQGPHGKNGLFIKATILKKNGEKEEKILRTPNNATEYGKHNSKLIIKDGPTLNWESYAITFKIVNKVVKGFPIKIRVVNSKGEQTDFIIKPNEQIEKTYQRNTGICISKIQFFDINQSWHEKMYNIEKIARSYDIDPKMCQGNLVEIEIHRNEKGDDEIKTAMK